MNETKSNSQDALDLRYVFGVLRERLWIPVVCTLLGAAAGFAYLKVAIPIFAAQASVEVLGSSRGPMGVPRPGGELNGDEALGTIEANLRRMSLFMRVMEREGIASNEEIGLPAALSPMAKAAELERWTRVKLRRDTRLIDIVVEHPDPEVASLLAGAIVEEFIEERSELDSGSSKSSFEMLLGETQKIDARLETLESALQATEKVLAAKALILEKETELEDLLQTKGELHPDVKAATAQLKGMFDDLEALLVKARPMVTGAGEAAPDPDVSPRQDALKAEADRFELSHRSITRDVDSERALRDVFVARLKEAEIVKDLEISPVVLVEPAFPPLQPVKPRPVRILGMSTILGFGLGVLLIWMIQALSRTLRTVDEAEKHVGLQVLGAIPFDKRLPQTAWLAKRRKRDLADLKLQFQPEINHKKDSKGSKAPKKIEKPKRPATSGKIEPLVLLSDPGSPTAESFRSLRAALMMSARRQNHKSFLVTSASPGEGKSVVACNLAVAFAAQTGKRTLLIDADLRCPTAATILDIGHHPTGLADAILDPDTEPAIVASGIAGLDFLPAGQASGNPAELLSSDAVPRLLARFAEIYDFVVLDSSPVNTVADALLAAASADSVLLVARANHTPFNAVKRARESLEDAGCSVAGLALTQVKARAGFASNPYYFHYYADSKNYTRAYE